MSSDFSSFFSFSSLPSKPPFSFALERKGADVLNRGSSPSGEVGEDLVDGAIGDILVHAVPTLSKREGDLIAHAKQLGKAQHMILNVK